MSMTAMEVKSLIFTAEKAGEKNDIPVVLRTILHVLQAITSLPIWMRWSIPSKWMVAITALIVVLENLINGLENLTNDSD